MSEPLPNPNVVAQWVCVRTDRINAQLFVVFESENEASVTDVTARSFADAHKRAIAELTYSYGKKFEIHCESMQVERGVSVGTLQKKTSPKSTA